jgi:hypothetical protein
VGDEGRRQRAPRGDVKMSWRRKSSKSTPWTSVICWTRGALCWGRGERRRRGGRRGRPARAGPRGRAQGRPAGHRVLSAPRASRALRPWPSGHGAEGTRRGGGDPVVGLGAREGVEEDRARAGGAWRRGRGSAGRSLARGALVSRRTALLWGSWRPGLSSTVTTRVPSGMRAPRAPMSSTRPLWRGPAIRMLRPASTACLRSWAMAGLRTRLGDTLCSEAAGCGAVPCGRSGRGRAGPAAA